LNISAKYHQNRSI